jgi:cytochrome c oxidase subunit I
MSAAAPDLFAGGEPDAPRDSDLDVAGLERRMAATWADRPGFLGWLMSVDHKSIARRYLVTAFVFLLLAGGLAMVMRLQLLQPEGRVLGPDLYNQFFTMHGTTMMFLFAVPVMEGVMIFLVPLMVGSRIIAFPRLNAFSYWLYLFGGVMLWAAFAMDVGPDVGWFAYPPLSGPEFGAGKRPDYWAQMITFTEISALAVAVEIVVTVLKLRAPGMSLDRMPIFVWAALVTSLMIICSMPSIVLASSFLLSDRLVGTHFYNYGEGGDLLLYQHLFWYFAHPEVYIIFLPGLGMLAQIIETFSRRPIFGYPAIVLALIGNGVLSFGLWVHHMFATGLPRLGNSFFTASSMAIAVPTGLTIFCWIATIASGAVRLTVPMLWVIAFFLIFIFGGLSGVMIASVPFDLQATDTYVIVSHIHLVLLGGAVAPLIGAAFYWFPKLTGRMLDERLGIAQFVLFVAGVLLSFGAMFVLGLAGMTRRIYTYPAGLGWDGLNALASVSSWVIGASFALFAFNILRAMARPATAPENPWNAPTLEWATASPPPTYNLPLVPRVGSRSPLWDDAYRLPVVTGLRTDRREVLVTTVADATPDLRDLAPDPSIWPLIAALATTGMFIGSIYTPWAVVWGAVPVGLALVAWLYPRRATDDLAAGRERTAPLAAEKPA